MVKCCPTCGHPIVGEEVEAALTPMQRKLFHAIKSSGRAGISNPEVMHRLYGDDPNGGPENSNVISVMVKRMRGVLPQYGLTIRADGGPGSRYYLEKIG